MIFLAVHGGLLLFTFFLCTVRDHFLLHGNKSLKKSKTKFETLCVFFVLKESNINNDFMIKYWQTDDHQQHFLKGCK